MFKRFIFPLFLFAMLPGCQKLTVEYNKQVVQEKYPGSLVQNVPGKAYQFLVARGCEVRLVSTYGGGEGFETISSDTQFMIMPDCEKAKP